MKKVSFFCAFLFLLIACVVIFLEMLGKRTHAPPPDLSRYTVSRQIEYSFSISNKTNHLIRKSAFLTFAPVKRTATQICEHIESSYPFKLSTDTFGNQILRFSLTNIPPYATKIIRIRALVKVSKRLVPFKEPDLSPYLVPEKFIESDDHRILELSRKLSTGSPESSVKNIFRWVSQNVRYTGYLSKPRGALYALLHKKGDCTEFTYLFVALCRAAGIPARCIGGYICRGNAVLKPGDYHNWAEFYLDGKWQTADPSNRVFVRSGSNYIAMRIIEAPSGNNGYQFQRFKCNTNNLRVAMNQ